MSDLYSAIILNQGTRRVTASKDPFWVIDPVENSGNPCAFSRNVPVLAVWAQSL